VAKHKLERFAQLKTFKNVVEPKMVDILNKDHFLKGNWNRDFFKNNNPIIIEVGCGKGEYTTGLAERFPDKNYIGIDIKGARMWRGARHAVENNMANVGFLRTRIEHISSFFAPDEISEIWVTFPDPQEKRIRASKRLTSTKFLTYYKNFLQPKGIIHLKTDNEFLYNYTCSVCNRNNFNIRISTNDLYKTNLDEHLLSIKTFYESQFLLQGCSIKYLSFELNGKETFEEPEEYQ
jgi:tRNA (guanine-N7-)-methyltransferase